jgi:hypothetical protein
MTYNSSEQNRVRCPECGEIGLLMTDGLLVHVWIGEHGTLPITDSMGMTDEWAVQHPDGKRCLLHGYNIVPAFVNLIVGERFVTTIRRKES